MSATIGYRDETGTPNVKARGPLRDIRKFIAQNQLPQMDPNKFPRPEYRRYPLMPLNEAGKPYYDSAGRTIVLLNPEDEDHFYKDHPEAQRVLDPEDQASELKRLREKVAGYETADRYKRAGVNAAVADVDKDEPAEQPAPKVKAKSKAATPDLSDVVRDDVRRPAVAAPKVGSKLD